MSKMTMLRSDVYHLLSMCHVYNEVKVLGARVI